MRNAIHDNAFHGIEVQLFVMRKVFCDIVIDTFISYFPAVESAACASCADEAISGVTKEHTVGYNVEIKGITEYNLLEELARVATS